MVSNGPPSKAVMHGNPAGQCFVNCSSRRRFFAKCMLMKLDTVRKPISLGVHNFRMGDPKTMISSSFDKSWRGVSFRLIHLASPTHVSLTTSEDLLIKVNIDVIEKYCKPDIVYLDKPIPTSMYTKRSAYIWRCACHLAAPSAYTWAE